MYLVSDSLVADVGRGGKLVLVNPYSGYVTRKQPVP